MEKKRAVTAKPKVTSKKGKTKSVSYPAPVSHGVGRRKAAVARVWLRPGKGNLIINTKEYTSYFDTDMTRKIAIKPFVVTSSRQYDVTADVSGGGVHSQADAIKLGIARALVAINESLRPVLRQHGLLTVDSRIKERKKPGQPGARRKFQFVKR